ncbi:hypothetical protein HOLleu_34020 [Holothuria leucospilota]|uniref:Septin-type G domain-containing protein n=1 Tax=Holothuria leucospilota TaxID=206669 RepID=A0A9Q0YPM2_HOLLE|nr:hypothetical protein HOLleu_34020 [Holothuria leucospilota]
MASNLLPNCNKISDGNPCIHTLDMKETTIRKESKIRRCEIGSKVPHQSEKVIMVVGATGSGKTAVINFFVNYILGVEWSSNFRYQLVPDECESKKKSQADSQTEWITAYTFYPQCRQAIPYTLTIIDTPGFGDTRGIKRDKEITEQIRVFFSTPSDYGIDQIDAIAFVAQAALPRLTETQKFIFDSVLSGFGKNIAENIFLFLTFADLQAPQILGSTEKASLPYKCYFKFNNSALYAQKDLKKDNQEQNSSDTDDDDDNDEEKFNQTIWKMGTKSFKKFFKELQNTSAKSITLSAEVLEERKRLETSVAGLSRLIRSRIVTLEKHRKEKEMLEQYKNEMVSNKNFTFIVHIEKTAKQDLIDDYAMVCHKCKFTCHYPCSPRWPKFTCSAMKFLAVVRGCGVCPMECSLSDHENVAFTYERERVEKTMTYADLLESYEGALRAVLKTEELVKCIEEDVSTAEIKIEKYLEKVSESLKRLQEIALKPNPSATIDYIDVLIQNEQSEGQKGWQERRKALLDLRQKAHIINKISHTETKVDYKELANPPAVFDEI